MTPGLCIALLTALIAGHLSETGGDYSWQWWIGLLLVFVALSFADTALRLDRRKRPFNLTGGELLTLDGKVWKVTSIEHTFQADSRKTQRIYIIRIDQK